MIFMSKLFGSILALGLVFSAMGFGPHASAADDIIARSPEASIFYSVKDCGAVGDGKAVDSPSINKAIEAASAGGGGTVYFPAGMYLSFSIRLKSNITLYLDNGATILAADPKDAKGTYDQWE